MSPAQGGLPGAAQRPALTQTIARSAVPSADDGASPWAVIGLAPDARRWSAAPASRWCTARGAHGELSGRRRGEAPIVIGAFPARHQRAAHAGA